uniref:Putative 40S ribosomal protein S24E n=1 Tax=Trypanosoma vivax (strain Y486) TaxID=1055687 RepID=G0U713_TRYVY|nr:putative 40S ribosomal protein S24E, fragment [Trypanosoma vivax Y486]
MVFQKKKAEVTVRTSQFKVNKLLPARKSVKERRNRNKKIRGKAKGKMQTKKK